MQNIQVNILHACMDNMISCSAPDHMFFFRPQYHNHVLFSLNFEYLTSYYACSKLEPTGAKLCLNLRAGALFWLHKGGRGFFRCTRRAPQRPPVMHFILYLRRSRCQEENIFVLDPSISRTSSYPPFPKNRQQIPKKMIHVA
jgi:hypothetical protein